MNTYPLTTPQRNIYELQTFYAGTGISNINGIAYMACELDQPILTRLVNRLLASHKAFHIQLTKTPEGAAQYFVAPKPAELEIIDLRNVPEGGWDEALSAYTASEMELFDRPLVEARLVLRPRDWGLLLKFSHLVADGWTATLCIEQSVGAYLAELRGSSVEQPESDYRDFIESERVYRDSDRYERDREFFLAHYAEPPRALTFRGPKHLNSVVAKRHVSTVPDEASERIRSYCQDRGVSPAVVFEAAIFVYLRRFFDTSGVTIGIPVLNRSGVMKKTMGMFVSTVPLVMEMPEEMPVRDLVTGLASKHLSLFRHQRFPYSDLLMAVRELHGGAERLFDVSFSYQNARAETEANARIDAGWIFSGFSENSLSVHVLDLMGTGRFDLYLDYLSDVFTEVEIDFVYRRLLTIVDNIITDDSVSVSDIGIMDEDEYRLVTETFNDTKVEYDETLTVVDLFERAVERWPDRTALVFENTRYTFRELDTVARQLAARLQSLGIRRGDVVGILTKRSDWTVISMLAVPKIGAAYLPLDVDYSFERIAYLLRESGACVVITHGYEGESPSDCVCLRIEDVHSQQPYAMPAVLTSPSDTYCVLHTSGSTGRPKCIALTHGNLVNFYENCGHLIGDSSVAISLTSQTFDVFRMDTVFPMVRGLKLVLPSQAELDHAERLAHLIDHNPGAYVVTVPTRMRHLLGSASLRSAMARIRTFLIVGEKFPVELLRDMRAEYHQARILNGYGPAEATLLATASELEDADVTAGPPLPNYRIFILDKRSRVVPIGVPGEVCIAGDGVAAGYIGSHSERSAFLVGSVPTYCSGDLGSWTFAGDVRILGRIDNQVKYRGVRIELEGLESLARDIEGVKNCAVRVFEDGDEVQQMLLYYEAEKQVSSSRFRTVLLSLLPRQALPSSYVRVTQLPLNKSGKLDRMRLSEADGVRSAVEEGSFAGGEEFVGDEEFRIASAWVEVLGHTSFGATDNFFDVGGDSLLAMRLLANVDRDLKAGISVRDIFDNSSVRQLAMLFRDRQPSVESVEVREVSVHPIAHDVGGRSGILLTGASGFLGSHVLTELIARGRGPLHVVVRDSARFCAAMSKYFGSEASSWLGGVVVHQGDLTERSFGLDKTLTDCLSREVGTIYHCAADVRHYAPLAQSKAINTDATISLLEFAAASGMEFNHASTISVAGFAMVSHSLSERIFDESSLDIGQRHDQNVYVHTKFLAECAVRAYQVAGLETRVFRLGNIGPRSTDGVFQVNAEDNGFESRKRAVARLGSISENMAKALAEVSPVDVCARAIVELAEDCSPGTYHVYNPMLRPVIELLHEAAIFPEVVDDSEFLKRMDVCADDPDVYRLDAYFREFSRLGISDASGYGGDRCRVVNDKTTAMLSELGVCWS